MKIRSRLLNKHAVDWAGPIDKTVHRDDQRAVSSVWAGINNKLHQLKQTLKIKGQPLASFLGRNPISELFTSNDPEVKRTGYQLRSLISEFVASEFETSVLNRFKAEEGSNVTQWLDKSGKTAASGLRMQPDYGEEGSYTTEANKENAKVGTRQFLFKAKFLQK